MTNQSIENSPAVESRRFIINKKDIISSLRSGNYQQATGKLYRGFRGLNASYCCIGVAGDVSGFQFKSNDDYTYSCTIYLDMDGFALNKAGKKYLNEHGQEDWVGDGGNEIELEGAMIHLNDTAKWSFDQIADFLEVAIPDGI